jgi:RNA polymerase-binding transcription factor DksA
MDEFDQAAALELMFRELAIKEARAKVRTPPPDFNGECPSCGTEVPQARVAAGYSTCIFCAREAELRHNQYDPRRP